MPSEAPIGGLSESTVAKLRGVFAAQPGVERVILYGSRAKGTARKGSDIDMTIVGESLDITALLRIETELDDLLLPYSIDLSLFHYVENADLIAQIERVGVTIYARSDRFPPRRKALSGNQA